MKTPFSFLGKSLLVKQFSLFNFPLRKLPLNRLQVYILLLSGLILTPNLFACEENKYCNNYVICDEHYATFTWLQFETWLKDKTSHDGFYILYTSSTTVKIMYEDNCKLKEVCYDTKGVCVP